LITEDELLAIYRGTVQPLYAYVSRRTGRQRELAEDTVQETYMRALSHWRRKGQPAVPLAWLKTVARNLLISHYRRINPKSLQEVEFDIENGGRDSGKRHDAAVLSLGLAHLKTKESRLLDAFYFDEQSVGEIAAESGLSERAVEGRLRRARQKLGEVLKRYSSEGGTPK
jgi:RNA polymerase sigma-70 factor (ECF subfamily)